MKQETHEGKLQTYIFEACERCVSNPDSETEFYTIFEQCASEKSKKVKTKKMEIAKVIKLKKSEPREVDLKS